MVTNNYQCAKMLCASCRQVAESSSRLSKGLFLYIMKFFRVVEVSNTSPALPDQGFMSYS